MVLTQREWLDRNGNIPFTFPYHYGSYATGAQSFGKGWETIAVSIPLWFLRNRFYYKDIIQVLGRQNQPNKKIP